MVAYFEKDFSGDVAAVLGEVEWDLFDHVADAQAAAEVRGGCQGVWVVYP